MPENRFGKFKLQDEGGRFAKWMDKAKDAAPPQVRQEPISLMERLAFQNLFDTQPERRKAYAKRIGLELDPEDGNKFRALGSPKDAPYDGEIDPQLGHGTGWGLRIAPEEFEKAQKRTFKETAEEFGKDIGDVAFDLGVAGPLTTAGAMYGAGAGGGPTPMGFVGGILGGAAGNVVAEETKAGLGDLLLNENIPTDKTQMALQSMLAGMATGIPSALRGGKKFSVGKWIQKRTEAVENLIKAQGQISDEAIQKAVEKPDMFTAEATAGARKKFLGFYKEFFGLDPEEDLAKKVQYLDSPPADSVIGKAMEPTRAARDAAIDQLSTNSSAQLSYKDAVSPIAEKVMELSGIPNRTPQQNEALSVLRDQLNNFKKFAESKLPKPSAVNLLDAKGNPIAQPKADVSSVLFSFRDLDGFKRGLQGNAFKETAVGSMSENPIVSQVAGQFRQKLDNVALNAKDAVGNPFPAGQAFVENNAKLAEGLNVFKQASSNLKPTKMISAFVTGPTENALETKQILGAIDKVTGSNYSKAFEDGALQSTFEQFFSKPTAVGSSNVNKAIAQESAKGAAKGAGVGAALGSVIPGIGPMAGAGVGSVAGGLRGAAFASKFANPTAAVQELGRLGEKAAANNAMSTMGRPGEVFISQALGRGAQFIPKSTDNMSDAELEAYIKEQEDLRRQQEEGQ